MKRFWAFAPWVGRMILVAPALIFALIASRYIAHPATSAALVGISLNTPLATTILRVGFGAFPLGCSIFVLSCLVSKRRILTGFIFVLTILGVALGVRLYGMTVDGTVSESMHLVRAEAVVIALCLIGIVVEHQRERRTGGTL